MAKRAQATRGHTAVCGLEQGLVGPPYPVLTHGGDGVGPQGRGQQEPECEGSALGV